MTGPLATRHMKRSRGLTIVGVDPSGYPLHDGIFHLPPPHTLDAQILETANKHGRVKLTGIYCDVWSQAWCKPVGTGSTGRGRDTNDPEVMFDLFQQTSQINLDSLEKFVTCLQIKAKDTDSFTLLVTHKQTNTHSHFDSLKQSKYRWCHLGISHIYKHGLTSMLCICVCSTLTTLWDTFQTKGH